MEITLGKHKFDLTSLGYKFDLNEQQVAALQSLARYTTSKDKTITLQGSAGTGKTTIVKIFLHYLKATKLDNYQLTAPTHKARLVLERLSGTKTSTIHSLLDLRPDLNLYELNMKNLSFTSKGKSSMGLPINGFLIIDEASMVNNDLFDLVVERCKEVKCKIIFIGDIAQLQPVKQGEISKVFAENTIVLTKVERQKDDNPLLDDLVILRDKSIPTFVSNNKDGKGLFIYDDARSFASLIKANITFASLVENPFAGKILCYTNTRVKMFNNFMRKLLKFDNAFCEGEVLMGYSNYTVNKQLIITNSGDYQVIVSVPCQRVIPHVGSVAGYDLTLRDLVDDAIYSIFILDENTSPLKLAEIGRMIESLRLQAIGAKTPYRRRMCWIDYYKIIESFTSLQDIVFQGRVIKTKTLDYGYAHTVHKSQGGTYTNVYVDMSDIMKCIDPNELRQLQYVALSRPTKAAHILQ